jgi:hypothetical protein
MTDEELRACASVPAQRMTVAPDRAPAPVTKGPEVQVTKPRAECVIKPVMTDEELRACASAPVERITVAPDSVPAARTEPERPKPPAECVIKPVMSEDDLRACRAGR